jgi:hypothetical protein
MIVGRKSDLHGLFAHIADINQPLQVLKPLLLGSRDGSDIHVRGYHRGSYNLASRSIA